MIRIVGIDPGQTTGYVDVLFDPNSGEWQVVDAQEIAWGNRFVLKPLLAGQCEHQLAGLPLPSIVVVEEFTLYAHKAKDQIGSHFPSARVIGTLEAYLDELGIMQGMILQPASVRSRVSVLPIHSPFVIGSDHMHDAYQHVRYFIVTHEPWLRHLQTPE